ncbi:NADH-quinone oxidoreductase subunit C [Myxococcota bacterium]|nr:NADH-quinone oxidoreductase subunit C [Myxococcota bacterium]
MEAEALFERLKSKFGDSVLEVVTDNPSPWIMIEKSSIKPICDFLRSESELAFDFLESISGVDLGDKLHMVYHLFSYQHRHSLVLKTELAYDALTLETVVETWSAANWLEREQFDLFGVHFENHPDLRRLLLPEDWVGYPLRKDYVYPTEYHGIQDYRPNVKHQFKLLDEQKLKENEAKKEQAQAALAASNADDAASTEESAASGDA